MTTPRSTAHCESCGGSGWDVTRAMECSPRCDGSHVDLLGRAVCPRGPEMCEPCEGTGKVKP
jgi:DnaJ-class molecular chaperone